MPAHPDSSPQVCRIGICDDLDAYRFVLNTVFEHEDDFEVVGEAATGHEAIDLVDRTPVDVLLLDVAMPDLDGVEALPRILQRSPSTKVVMLTGFGTPAIRDRSLAAGACRYVEKGLTALQLVDVVREVCGDCLRRQSIDAGTERR